VLRVKIRNQLPATDRVHHLEVAGSDALGHRDPATTMRRVGSANLQMHTPEVDIRGGTVHKKSPGFGLSIAEWHRRSRAATTDHVVHGQTIAVIHEETQ
jgi:hypothetical protein